MLDPSESAAAAATALRGEDFQQQERGDCQPQCKSDKISQFVGGWVAGCKNASHGARLIRPEGEAISETAFRSDIIE